MTVTNAFAVLTSLKGLKGSFPPKVGIGDRSACLCLSSHIMTRILLKLNTLIAMHEVKKKGHEVPINSHPPKGPDSVESLVRPTQNQTKYPEGRG